MSYYRDGADLMPCIKCRDKFDLNDPSRSNIIEEKLGGKYQPLCERCLRMVVTEDREVYCIACEERAPLDKVETIPHIHAGGMRENVFVCSHDCTLSYLRNGPSDWKSDVTDIPDPFDENRPRGEISQEAKDVADKVASYITENYRCTATHHPELVVIPTLEFVIGIERRKQPVTEQYVKRFDRISIPTEHGTATLILTGHSAFGVCRFRHEITNK